MSNITTTPSTTTCAEHTPMMKQYLKIKQEYPDTFLFYRMGDFYELFNEDAKVVSKILGIQLTARGKSGGQPIAMAGVPHHSADSYLAKLLKLGHCVAICEQTGEAKAGKGPMQREVVRILTPGTVTDEALIEDQQATWVASIFSEKDHYALACLNITSGEFWVRHYQQIDPLWLELEKMAPSELLISENQSNKESLQQRIPNTITSIERPPWDFSWNDAHRKLCHQFKTQSLTAFELDDKPVAVSAAGALLSYIQYTQRTALHHIQGITYQRDNHSVHIDQTTCQNLELLFNLQGKHKHTLAAIIDHSATPMGTRLIRHWLLHPTRDHNELQKRQQSIAGLLPQHNAIKQLLLGMGDIERILARVALRSAKPRDLVQLNVALTRVPALKEQLQELISLATSNHAIIELENTLQLFPQLSDELERALTCPSPSSIRDGGFIAGGYDETLDELRHLQNDCQASLQKMEQTEREQTGIATLKVNYNRVHGFFIEISKAQASLAPAHYIRRQTLKNAERFITPDLKTFEDKVLSSRHKALAREKQLYEELLDRLLSQWQSLHRCCQTLTRLDVLNNLAERAESLQLIAPTFTQERLIDIKEGRHLVVEATSEHPFIANDTLLNQQHSLQLITGPNMGGKSTYMRQVALITLLAYIGSYVPATAACLGPIDRIFTRIGAADDVASGRSTFMVEMTETANILHHATDQSLVLMDEIGRGTSTADGLAIAYGCTKYLSQLGCYTLFATHYFELTTLANDPSDPSPIINVHLDATEHQGDLVFLHRLKPGAANKSYGIEVAKLAGIPTAVLKLAASKLQQLEYNKTTLLEKNKTILNEPAIHSAEQTMQASLPFMAPVNQTSPLVEKLNHTEPDQLTPRQALELIYQLKKLTRT